MGQYRSIDDEKVKILAISNFFPPNVLGGYEIGCHDILCGISGDADIHLVTSFSTFYSHDSNNNIGVTVCPIFKPCSAYSIRQNSKTNIFHHERAFSGYIPENVLALRDKISEFKPDLIYLFNILGIGPVGILEICVESGIPTVCHLMDEWDGFFTSKNRRIDLSSKWKALKAQVTVIACSDYTLKSNSKVGVFGKSFVLPSGVRFPMSLPLKQSVTSQNKFLYFGQLHPGKGIHRIIEAFHEALFLCPNSGATLTIIGRGEPEYMKKIHNMALSESHAASSIRFLPYMPKEKLMNEIPNFDLTFCPLLSVEAFGYAPVESAAAGVPVVICRDMPLFSYVENDSLSPLIIKNQDDVGGLRQIMLNSINQKINLDSLRQIQFHCFKAKFDEKSVFLPRILKILSDLSMPSASFEKHMDSVVANACIYEQLLSSRLSKEENHSGVKFSMSNSKGGRLVKLAKIIENRVWELEKKLFKNLT